MINNVFTDTFNFLVSSLNNMNQESKKGKNEKPSDALKRLIDTVQFIYTKRTVFNTNLDAIREELVQMKSEAVKLKNQISKSTKNSLIFTIESLIDSLIIEVDNEIEKRKKSESAVQSDKSKKSIKVKVFKSAFAETVEKEMNNFLTITPDIEIVNTLQSVENNTVCVSIFYK